MTSRPVAQTILDMIEIGDRVTVQIGGDERQGRAAFREDNLHWVLDLGKRKSAVVSPFNIIKVSKKKRKKGAA